MDGSVHRLDDRHALVCGASRGIGRAAAFALAARGAELTLLARSEATLAALVGPLHDAGSPAVHVAPADLDRRDLLDEVLTGVLAPGPVHIVVNNTAGPPGGPLLEATADAILGAIGRHLLAAHHILQATLPGMREAGYGRFVQVLSTSVREPIDHLGVSNLTRAAVASWAKTLSRELPPGVTINNVLPGFTDTDRLDTLADNVAQRTGRTADAVRVGWRAMVPEGRIGRPEELGEAIAFLCSPAAAYIRGVSLPVDGGRLRSI